MGQDPLGRAIAAIKQHKPDLAADAEVAKVAALLPSDATWIAYCSPQGLFDFVKQTMAAALPAGSPVKIPAFGPTPPVAMAVTSGPEEVEFHLIVPAEVMKTIGQLVGKAPGDVPPTER
jgi:ferredoxin-NADP reductase